MGHPKGTLEPQVLVGSSTPRKGPLVILFPGALVWKQTIKRRFLGYSKLSLLPERKVLKISKVFRDSEILIEKLIKEDFFNNAGLNKIMDRLKRVLLGFDSYKFYHILRNSNKEADRLANLGCTLMKGILIVNGESFFQNSWNCHIPKAAKEGLQTCMLGRYGKDPLFF